MNLCIRIDVVADDIIRGKCSGIVVVVSHHDVARTCKNMFVGCLLFTSGKGRRCHVREEGTRWQDMWMRG